VTTFSPDVGPLQQAGSPHQLRDGERDKPHSSVLSCEGMVFSGLSVSNAVFTLQYFQVIMAFGEHNPMVSQGASICVWFQRSK
jgi:hypothetical protein